MLSGRLRLLLGDRDLTLTPGEVAEFDTRIPHLFFNPGPGTAEVLSLFGPQGERLHVRARPSPHQTKPPPQLTPRPPTPAPAPRRILWLIKRFWSGIQSRMT